MRWFSDLLGGLLRGGAEEVGWDDVMTKVVDALAGAAHWGARGQVTFPPAVLVEVAVPEASVDVVRRFLADARFDREAGAALANRCDVAAEAAHVLPQREYDVVAASRLAARVREQAPRSWQLVVQGGDLDGKVLSVPAGAGELGFGRGGEGGSAKGESQLVVCERTAFVSRRAGALAASGAQLEVMARDQGDLLAVRKPDGELVRPSRTARGRVALREGDVIELGDGRGEQLRLLVRRAVAATAAGAPA